MANRTISREYLEEAYKLAKRDLPGWAFAMLHAEARPKSGGRAANRVNRPDVIQKLGLMDIGPKKLAGIKDQELTVIWEQLLKWHASAKKTKQPVDDFTDAGLWVADELDRRKIQIADSRLLDEIEKLRKVRKGCDKKEPIKKMQKIVPFVGPKNAKIAFIGTAPSLIDAIRQEPFAGPIGKTINDLYLKPLGIPRDQVLFGNIIPFTLDDNRGPTRDPEEDEIKEGMEWMQKQLDEKQPYTIVALGRVAKSALMEQWDFVLPHPLVVARWNSGEVKRKLKRIKDRIQKQSIEIFLDSRNNLADDENLNATSAGVPSRLINKSTTKAPEKTRSSADITGEPRKGRKSLTMPIIKADRVKKIVYGVVLSAYGKDGAAQDAHNDFTSPAEIEKTAHDWFRKSRVVGVGHPGMGEHAPEMKVEAVESHIEEYPSQEDYIKAMNGKSHKVRRRKYGDDVVYSGDWILGSHLDDKAWKSFENGDYNAYSVEGFGIKKKASTSAMPKVTFVEWTSK